MNESICKFYGEGEDSRDEGGFRKIPCGKGHDIRVLVGGDTLGWMLRQPCTEKLRGTRKLRGDRGYGCITCLDREYPTADDVEEYMKYLNEQIIFLERGVCPKCMAKLEQHGKTWSCSNCLDVSVRNCGAHDIDS